MPITVVAPLAFEDDDYHSLVMNLTGGFKAWQRSQNEWSIGPIIYNDEVVMAGILSFAELRSAMSIMGLSWTVFEHRVVMSGVITKMWRSVEPVGMNSALSATDVWQTIRANSTSRRVAQFRAQFPDSSAQEILTIMEQSNADERLSEYISDSLRSMDICISSISDFYHDQLTTFLREGRAVGAKSCSVADLPFVANVHSFFVHFGAARDYLAALLAYRCGLSQNTEAMNRLLDKLTWNNLPNDPIIQHLVKVGCFAAKPNSTKTKLAGWLEDASNVRNELVHRRPFGSHESERYGHIQNAGGLEGHFRFFKPIHVGDGSTTDTLDYLADLYGKTTKLFGEIALISGADTAIQTLS